VRCSRLLGMQCAQVRQLATMSVETGWRHRSTIGTPSPLHARDALLNLEMLIARSEAGSCRARHISIARIATSEVRALFDRRTRPIHPNDDPITRACPTQTSVSHYHGAPRHHRPSTWHVRWTTANAHSPRTTTRTCTATTMVHQDTIALPHGAADGPLPMLTHTTRQLAAAQPLPWCLKKAPSPFHMALPMDHCQCSLIPHYNSQLHHHCTGPEWHHRPSTWRCRWTTANAHSYHTTTRSCTATTMVLKEGTIALPHGAADGPLPMLTHTTLQLTAAPPLHWS
jgi:hypothetical protein